MIFERIQLRAPIICLLSFLICIGNAGAEKNKEVVDNNPSNPILIKTDKVEVRKTDFETWRLQLSPGLQNRILNDKGQIRRLALQIMQDKTLAYDAKKMGLDKTPEGKALIEAEYDRIYGKLMMAHIQQEALAQFESKRNTYEQRAKELYTVNKKRYETPERVNASHILFSLEKHSEEEGLTLAEKTRAEILGGADFNQKAKELSEDPSVRQNAGNLGWFTRENMVPEFSAAAFAMKEKGEISTPVLSKFGWHIILLHDKTPAGVKPFEAVKDEIMANLQSDFLASYQTDVLDKMDNNASIDFNENELDALYIKSLSEAEIQEKIREAIKK